MAIVPIQIPTTENNPHGNDSHYQFISQYVADLRTISGYYIGYVDQNMADTVGSYELLKNDLTIKQSIHLLSIMVAGEYYDIYCRNPYLKDIIARGLSSIRDFIHVRKSLVEQAVLFGLGVQKKYYDCDYWPEYGQTWHVPTRMMEVDRRRMRLERNPNNRNDVYWTIWSPASDSYKIIEDRNSVPGCSLSVQDFVWYVHEREELNPLFRGLGEVLYQAAYIKSKLLQYWADLSEHFGKPILMAAIDTMQLAINSSSSQGHGFYDAKRVIDQYLEVLETMRCRHSAVYPKGDEIKMIEGGKDSNNMLAQFLEYLDGRIQTLILGSKLITESPTSGSFAQAQVHRGTTGSIVGYNRSRLEEVLLDDLIMDFLERNRHNLMALGIPFPKRGEIAYRIRVETEEMRKEALATGNDRNVRAGDKI